MQVRIEHDWHGNSYYGRISVRAVANGRWEGEVLSLTFDSKARKSIIAFFAGSKKRMDWCHMYVKDYIGLKKIYDRFYPSTEVS